MDRRRSGGAGYAGSDRLRAVRAPGGINRAHIVSMLALLVIVAAGKVASELYRWYGSAEERAELQRLGIELEDAGLEVIRSQVEASERMEAIARLDRSLSIFRHSISGRERRATRDRMPAAVYDDYLFSLESYNGSVDARNRSIDEWREIVARNELEVERYNALADTMRSVAAALGEPYFPIPTPAEAAMRRGFGADPDASLPQSRR